MITVCFTGHRPDKLGGYNNEKPDINIFVRNWLEEVTRRLIEKFGDVHFISGGAQGVDLIAAEVVLEHKRNYADKNIKLTMAIPCPEFGDRWPSVAKKHLKDIINEADKMVYVRDSYTGPIVLQIRNEWMVDRSDIVVAVWNGTSGGTKNCIFYAKDLNRRIIRLDLKTGETFKN